MRRRFFLMGFAGAGSVIYPVINYWLSQKSQSLDNPQRSFNVKGDASLKVRAAAKCLLYGAAARYKQLKTDPAFAQDFVREVAVLVPEWEFKWKAGDQLLRPGPKNYDFRATDWMVDFAQTHGLLLRGHTLVWHDSLPAWVYKVLSPQNARQLLTEHIQRVAGRYAGRMHSWDVVNEAVAYDPRKGRSDGLRESPWLHMLGPNYIDLAFHTAASADPNAMLVYNDFGVDYDTGRDEAKRNAILKLLERLKKQGTPVDALGIQAHLQADSHRDFNASKFSAFLRNVADLGLKILITELDVVDQKLFAAKETRDRIIAGIYEDYLTVALQEPAVISVITWGLSDRYTYISESHPRTDGDFPRPLPLDQDLNPKLAWNAIARTFDYAAKRNFKSCS